MSGRAFLDTNVLVYAFDDAYPAKQERALQIMATASTGDVVLSTQVLQEFYVAVTRKLRRPVPQETAAAAVDALARLNVVQVDPPMVVAAIATHRRYQLSLWDALVIEAARAAGCERVLSEDLQSGLTVGGVVIENPFAT